MGNGEQGTTKRLGHAGHLACRTQKRAEKVRMSVCGMLNVVKGVSGNLGGNDAVHEQETNQGSRNEEWAC